MLDTRIVINTVYPSIRTDGQQTREYFVHASVNGQDSTTVMKESELTKEMRNVLKRWFVQMYRQLPKDMQINIKNG